MYTCSITGMPFNQNPKAVVIPVLIRKDFTDSNIANANICPFPISVLGSFSEDVFLIDTKEKDRENFMMEMISSVIGRSITWKDFQQLRGDEKEVKYDDKDYIISFFACHQNIYNSIFSDFKAQYSFSKQKLHFEDYRKEFLDTIAHETKKLSHLVDEPYRTKLGSNRTRFVIPDNFNEVHLSYFAEIKFLNSFLSMIGKSWESYGVCSYDSSLAFKLYKDSVLQLI
jgi:hypothetical protein